MKIDNMVCEKTSSASRLACVVSIGDETFACDLTTVKGLGAGHWTNPHCNVVPKNDVTVFPPGVIPGSFDWNVMR